MTARIAHLRVLTRDERSDLASLLAGIDEADWDEPSPCPTWRVRDVVAHLVGWDDLLIHHRPLAAVPAAARTAWAMAAAGFRAARLNDRTVARLAAAPPGALLERFQGQAGSGARWAFERVAPGAQLAEYVVHHQDIRGAVGRPRRIPAERLVASLDGIRHLPGLDARAALRRHRWIATDVDWSAGRGDPVHAAAEDILLTLAGRPPASARRPRSGRPRGRGSSTG